mgnify:CR=1 FL=1
MLITLLFAGKQIFAIEYPDDTPFYNYVDAIAIPTEKTRHFSIIFNAFVFM